MRGVTPENATVRLKVTKNFLEYDGGATGAQLRLFPLWEGWDHLHNLFTVTRKTSSDRISPEIEDSMNYKGMKIQQN
jgi:hypothetical protein